MTDLRKSLTFSTALIVPLFAITAYSQSQLEPMHAKVGAFHAKLFLVNDQKALREEWSKPSTPRINIINEAKRGETISTGIVFKNCTVSNTNKCDLRAKYLLNTPSKKGINGGTGILWANKPLTGQFMLGSSSASIPIGHEWELGRYSIDVTITDHVSSESVVLSTAFVVIE